MLKLSIAIVIFVVIGYFAWSYYNPPMRTRPDISIKLETITEKENLGKVLIIYYSLDGNTHDIANRIQKITDGDLYEIKTLINYPSIPVLFWIAKKQLKNNELPELIGEIPDIDRYDVIFFGSPVWWFTVPSPVLSFLSKYDFKGKNVFVFVSHGGNYGTFFEDFKKYAKNATMRDVIDFPKSEKKNLEMLNKKILNWIENIKRDF